MTSRCWNDSRNQTRKVKCPDGLTTDLEGVVGQLPGPELFVAVRPILLLERAVDHEGRMLPPDRFGMDGELGHTLHRSVVDGARQIDWRSPSILAPVMTKKIGSFLSSGSSPMQ
jgi:hypothetical protein